MISPAPPPLSAGGRKPPVGHEPLIFFYFLFKFWESNILVGQNGGVGVVVAKYLITAVQPDEITGWRMRWFFLVITD